MAEILDAVVAAGGMTAMPSLTPAELAATFIAPAFACHVAEDAEMLGFQALCPHPGLPAGWADIATFARLDRRQGGVGTALFAATVEAARRLGIVAINATIRADNAGGFAFYRKAGFVTWTVTPAVPLADGTPVDRIATRYDVPPV